MVFAYLYPASTYVASFSFVVTEVITSKVLPGKKRNLEWELDPYDARIRRYMYQQPRTNLQRMRTTVQVKLEVDLARAHYSMIH